MWREWGIYKKKRMKREGSGGWVMPFAEEPTSKVKRDPKISAQKKETFLLGWKNNQMWCETRELCNRVREWNKTTKEERWRTIEIHSHCTRFNSCCDQGGLQRTGTSVLASSSTVCYLQQHKKPESNYLYVYTYLYIHIPMKLNLIHTTVFSQNKNCNWWMVFCLTNFVSSKLCVFLTNLQQQICSAGNTMPPGSSTYSTSKSQSVDTELTVSAKCSHISFAFLHCRHAGNKALLNVIMFGHLQLYVTSGSLFCLFPFQRAQTQNHIQVAIMCQEP